jgi:hypothetical protein
MPWDLPALLPIREEGVLRIFIALKNPSPWSGSNLQPFDPVASTLTTTPPRRLALWLVSIYKWSLLFWLSNPSFLSQRTILWNTIPHIFLVQEQQTPCCLSGILVSMLAIGPKVCGFKPGWGDGFLRVIKIPSMPSFGGKVKQEALCHMILWNVKTTCRYEQKYFARPNSSFPLHVPPVCYQMTLLVGLPDGRIRRCVYCFQKMVLCSCEVKVIP